MCHNHNIKTIAKSKYGELSFCTQCNIYHLSFNNLFFEFTPNELESFRKYIFMLEVEYWEQKYNFTRIKRKIPIPSTQQNLFLMFNKQEIIALRTLFMKQNDPFSLLHVEDIDYTYILN